MSIEICGYVVYYIICMDVFFHNRYVVTKLLKVNGCACPMKELLPGRLKKTSDAPVAVLTMVLALA